MAAVADQVMVLSVVLVALVVLVVEDQQLRQVVLVEQELHHQLHQQLQERLLLVERVIKIPPQMDLVVEVVLVLEVEELVVPVAHVVHSSLEAMVALDNHSQRSLDQFLLLCPLLGSLLWVQLDYLEAVAVAEVIQIPNHPIMVELLVLVEEVKVVTTLPHQRHLLEMVILE